MVRQLGDYALLCARRDRLFKYLREHGETYVRLRQLEAEVTRWKLWDGRFPSWMLQMGYGTPGSLSPTMFLPPITAPDLLKTSRADEKK